MVEKLTAPWCRGTAAETADDATSRWLIMKVFRAYTFVSFIVSLSSTLGQMLNTLVAGNLLGETSVAAIGLAAPVTTLLTSAGCIVGLGSVTLAARALGRRDAELVSALFSVAAAAGLALGLAIGVAGFLAAEPLAALLGASDPALVAETAAYLRGIFLFSFAMVMSQTALGFTRVDGAPVLALVATIGMSVLTIAISVVSATALGLGTFGMGVATSLPFAVAVLLCCTRFVRGTGSVRLSNPVGHLGVLPGMLKTGAPDSLTFLCVTLRTLTLNQLLLGAAGAAAVTALSVHSSISLFLTSLTTGIAETGVLLFSIFFGEEDADALRLTARVALRIGIPLSAALSVACFIFAPQVVGVFGLEGAAFGFAVAAVRAYCFYVPIDLLLTVCVNFYQSTDNLLVANVLTVGQCYVLPAGIAVGAAQVAGADGVWWSFPCGVAACLVLLFMWGAAVYARRGERPASVLDDLLVVPRGFQADWLACATFGCAGDVDAAVTCSEELASWCRAHGVDRKRTYQVALAVEEMAGNVLRHGPAKPGERVEVEVKIIAKRDGSLILRLRDNGQPFNPLDFDLAGVDKFACIGIRMIRAVVGNMEYQNAVGLNNLVFTLPA